MAPSELTFTIITPTLLRPSLVDACKSIHDQKYINWKHIVIVDDPKVNIDEFVNKNYELSDPRRLWLQCSKSHHNVGNTCRHQAYWKISPFTDYVLYLDDDNYYLPNSFNRLSNELKLRGMPPWGIFPMNYLGRLLCDPQPRKYRVDTGQIYHKPIVNEQHVYYPDVNDYGGDAVLVDYLTGQIKPTILDNLPPLLELPIRSRGAPLSSNPFAVVIPNHYEDVISPLLKSIKDTKSEYSDTYIVADGHFNNYGYKLVPCTQQKFIYSKAANAGITASSPKDIILVNDDVRLTDDNFFHRLFELAYSDPSIGILSPIINGGCGNVYMDANRVQDTWGSQRLMYRPGLSHDYISFVCVYIKRQLVDEIGLLDENFVGYGKDDADYCIRAVSAGWKIAITRLLKVNHGIGGSNYVRGKNWNTSYARRGISDQKTSNDYFFKKYPSAPRERIFPQPFALPKQIKTVPGTSWKHRQVNVSRG